MQSEIKKSIDAFLEKDNEKAKQYFKEAIQKNEKYKDYMELLREYGFSFETAIIPEKTYTDIQEILQDFPKEVKLKVLDETWKMIKNGKVHQSFPCL
jgi:hypothetical protein